MDIAKEGQVKPLEMVGTRILSPILQVDGEVVIAKQAKYSFMNMCAEEHILDTLNELFPRKEVKCSLESRERVEPLSAHHLCILEVKAITKDRNLSWPDVEANQAVVFEEVKRILCSCDFSYFHIQMFFHHKMYY